MDFGLKNRAALVMGGTKGLGRSIADALGEEGAALTISGRDQGRLDDKVGLFVKLYQDRIGDMVQGDEVAFNQSLAPPHGVPAEAPLRRTARPRRPVAPECASFHSRSFCTSATCARYRPASPAAGHRKGTNCPARSSL